MSGNIVLCILISFGAFLLQFPDSFKNVDAGVSFNLGIIISAAFTFPAFFFLTPFFLLKLKSKNIESSYKKLKLGILQFNYSTFGILLTLGFALLGHSLIFYLRKGKDGDIALIVSLIFLGNGLVLFFYAILFKVINFWKIKKQSVGEVGSGSGVSL